MSYKEAIEDGIEVVRADYYTNYYYPLCHICGEKTKSMKYVRGQKYTCPV